MNADGEITHGWPGEPALSELARRAYDAVADGDPLAVALLGRPPGLPVVDRDADARAVLAMSRVREELEALGRRDDPADEVDRVALLCGLRRATATARPGEAAGSPLLERHLMLRLVRLVLEAPGAEMSLLTLLEAAPSMLTQARGAASADAGGASGELALEAARRVPALLDAVAGAAAALPMPVDLRLRIEAALGQVLQAAAEDAGWLLKEYIPAEREGPAAVLLDPLWAGLGLSIAELEAEAEAALAEAVVALADDPVPAPEPDAAVATTVDVASAWQQAADQLSAGWGIVTQARPAGAGTPGWLSALVPPLALALPGPLGAGDGLLLVGRRPRGGLLEAVGELHALEYVPGAASRDGFRVARLVLPCPELFEGWRALVRGQPVRAAGTWNAELAWRASLALAAIAMARGRATVDDAATLLADEAGVDAEEARLQALQVARRPLAALTFLAGRRLMIEAQRTRGDLGAAALLLQGPLPGAAIRAFIE